MWNVSPSGSGLGTERWHDISMFVTAWTRVPVPERPTHLVHTLISMKTTTSEHATHHRSPQTLHIHCVVAVWDVGNQIQLDPPMCTFMYLYLGDRLLILGT